jgi:hypothetical protein
MELLFELVLQLVLDIAGQVFFELLTAAGWGSADSPGAERRRPVLAGLGQFSVGVIAGVLSLLAFRTRLVPRPLIPGVSLALSPIATGIVMQRLGDWWSGRGRERPVLFSFWAGAIFALGMALVRFVYLELGWNPF